MQLWVFDVRAAEPKAIPYNTGSERMIGVLIFTGDHYDTVEYRSHILSGEGSSLFPAGCGDRLAKAVVGLIHPNSVSRVSPVPHGP